MRTAAEEALDALPGTLDLAIARTSVPARGVWWRVLVSIIQWVAIVAGLAGALWLVGAALLPTFGFPTLLTPTVETGPLDRARAVAAALGVARR